MRWFVERDIIDDKRGIGLWFRRGCAGTEYGDPRRNEFLSFHILLLFMQFNLHFSWKGKVDE